MTTARALTATATSRRHRTFEVDGAAVHTWSTGRPADGPLFVLVHGIGMSSRYFRPLGAALAPHVSVLAVDLPGFGRSARPAHPMTLARHAGVVSGVLDLHGPMVDPRGPAWYAAHLQLMLSYRLADRLQGVHLPTAVVRGERDVICDRQWALDLAGAAELGTFTQVPGAPHDLMYDFPDPVAAVCVQALR